MQKNNKNPILYRFNLNSACSITLLILAFLSIFLSTDSYAQSTYNIVPGREQKDLGKSRVPLQKDYTLPSLALPSPKTAADINFTLKKLSIRGNKAVSADELEYLWSEYKGKVISVSQIYEIANAITEYYADKGLALSFAFIPNQEISSGNAIIQITEGFVEKIIFQNEAGVITPKIIQAMANKIKASQPLQQKDLERFMLLINDQPGYVAQAVFTRSKTENASDLLIKLARKPIQTSLLVDNHLNRTLGRMNFKWSSNVNGFINGTDSIKVSKSCGLSCNLYNQQGVSWTTALSAEGTRLSVGIQESKEAPNEGILSIIDFEGESQSFNLQIDHPLIRSRQLNLYSGLALRGINSNTETFAGKLYEDRVRALSAYGQFDYIDKRNGYSQTEISVEKGLPSLGATKDSNPLRSRLHGSSEYTKLMFSGSYSQPLDYYSTHLENYSATISANIQQSLSGALLAISQCFYGGSVYGQGYENALISGDNCMMGGVEIAKNIQLGDEIGLQIYAFGDWGIVTRRGPITNNEERFESASSAGLGTRAALYSALQGELVLGLPLNQDISGEKPAPTQIMFYTSLQF